MKELDATDVLRRQAERVANAKQAQEQERQLALEHSKRLAEWKEAFADLKISASAYCIDRLPRHFATAILTTARIVKNFGLSEQLTANRDRLVELLQADPTAKSFSESVELLADQLRLNQLLIVALEAETVEEVETELTAEVGKVESDPDVVPMVPKEQTFNPDEPLFHIPKQIVKTLNRDLSAAGIAKKDDRGRTIDFHALRHSFGTLLSTSGVTPRTAQQAMRHSEIGLTMNVYTDPRLLDVAGAVESLPSLPLSDSLTSPGQETKRATGTDDRQSFVAPKAGKMGQIVSVIDKQADLSRQFKKEKRVEKNNVFPLVGESGRQDLNLRPLRPERSALPG